MTKTILIKDVFFEIIQFTDAKTFATLPRVCKQWHQFHSDILSSFRNESKLVEFMKKRGVDPRLQLFSPELKVEKNSWIQKFREDNPLSITIYFKALEYFLFKNLC